MANRIEHPLDPYAGPPWFATEPDELSDGERQEEIVLMRKWDKKGEDTAFELGLSESHMPAQGEGEHPNMNTDPKELLP